MDRAEQFLRLADLLPEGVLLVSMSGRILAANGAAAKMFGRSDVLLRGEELHTVCSEPAEQIRKYLRRSAGTRSMTPGALHVVRPGDTPLACRCEGALYHPREGTQEPLVVLRLLPKAHGTRQFAALTLRVAELAQEVKRRRMAEDELARHDRRKDEFLAILAHELRNPMAPMRTALQLMELAEAHPEVQAEARGIMRRQTEHMVRLIDDLLDVSRINRGKIELRRRPVELAAIIKNAVETSRPLIESRSHELLEELPAEPVMLHGDPTRLTQVFANLLNNSAKYTDPGGRITIRARIEAGDVLVTVSDNGMGIAAETLPNLFDMFSHGRSINGVQGGLGVGLSLVKRMTEMHGGQVAADSRGPGQGSEFTVRLPILRRQPQEQSMFTDPIGDAASQKRRIVLADDNEDSANSLGMLLGLLGNEVRVAHSGQQALDLTQEFQPEVLVLDIGMPGMDGYEAARRARQAPWGRDLTLVALTGWGQETDKRRAREAGFDHHLVKPVDVSQLQTLLETLPQSPAGSRSEPAALKQASA